MGPSLTADFNAMIKWSLDSKRSNAEFTERLGLPQAEASKHKIGQPKFEGKAADLCMKLYKSTNAAVKSLKGRYPTVSDLKSAIYQQDELSIARITGPLLREHGPDIWSRFEPYATRLGLAKYPRRLEYFNDTHRERIELYVYCWIMTRVRENIMSQGRPAQGNRRAAQTHDLSDDEEEDSVIDDDAAASRANEYLNKLMEDLESDRLQYHASPITNPGVPIAPMLPLRNNVAAASKTNTVRPDGKKVASRSNDPTASADVEAASGSDDEGSSNLQARPGRLSRIKRRYTSGQQPSSVKKQRIARPESSVSDLQAPAYSTRQRTREEADDNGDLYAYPSPPLVQHDTTDDEGVTRNFPNIPDPRRDDEFTETTMSGAVPEGTVVTPEQDIRSTSVRSVDDAIVVGVQRNPTEGGADNDNADHAQDTDPEDDMPLRPRTSKQAPAKAAPCRLVVPIRFTAPSEDDEFFRRRLASDLLDILLEQLQQANTCLCSGLLSLLESRFKAEHLRLREVFDNDFSSHKESFDCWIECLGHVIQFYNSTGFDGSLSTRPTFIKTIPKEQKMRWIKSIAHGRKSLDELRKKRSISIADIAKEVGSSLFHLASWDGLADVDDVERMTLDFTVEMLAWFK